MPKLSTQPATAQPSALRSGFFSLPLSSGVTLFARLHSSLASQIDEDEPSTSSAAAQQSNALFITQLPLGATVRSITKLLNAIYPLLSVESVELLGGDVSSSSSLLERELLTSTLDNNDVLPLFSAELAAKLPSSAPPRSCIAHFSGGSPSLPPPPYSSTLALALPSAASALSSSSARHALARPHLSSIIAHTDTWMQAFDARKLAQTAAKQPLPVGGEATMSKSAAKKLARKNGGKLPPAEPLPGSAAAALAQHSAQRAKEKDKTLNPDEVDEEGWTLVTAGGKHGRSVLPEGVVANLSGYGGVSVKIAGKRGKGALADEDAGVKSIVGEGFYRFKKEEGRRAELLKMASEFEQDREKARRFRQLAESGPGAHERRLGAGGGRGTSRGSSRGGARGGRGGSRGGSSRGKEGRSYKPY